MLSTNGNKIESNGRKNKAEHIFHAWPLRYSQTFFVLLTRFDGIQLRAVCVCARAFVRCSTYQCYVCYYRSGRSCCKFSPVDEQRSRQSEHTQTRLLQFQFFCTEVNEKFSPNHFYSCNGKLILLFFSVCKSRNLFRIMFIARIAFIASLPLPVYAFRSRAITIESNERRRERANTDTVHHNALIWAIRNE